VLVRVRVIEGRVLRFAPWLLGLSVLIHLVMVATMAKMTMIDLLVYRNGSPSIFDGTLYNWRLSQYSEQFALPFTYPPFAALVFSWLSLLPWLAVRWLWQLASVACLYWLVHLSCKLLRQDREANGSGNADPLLWQRRAMLWTALAMWVEPVRTTLNYGQVNLFLAAVVLAGMVSARPVLSGLSVGLTAGIKLTPALSGIYFLATKRWAAAIWSFVAFAVTVLIAYLYSPSQSISYWFHDLSDPTRIGPPGSAINQSLRGALSRTFGHDVGTGPIWLVGAVIAAVLLVFALRAAVRAGDTLAGIVAVQFFTLLVSPISWSHHWVWMVPAVLWLAYGRARGGRLVTWTGVLWMLATVSYLISFLLKWQTSIWLIPRPWWQTVLGWVYPACGLLTLVAIGVALSRLRRPEQPKPVEPALPATV
jgi:alpha-1,2-mannosyltransferase